MKIVTKIRILKIISITYKIHKSNFLISIVVESQITIILKINTMINRIVNKTKM